MVLAKGLKGHFLNNLLVHGCWHFNFLHNRLGIGNMRVGDVVGIRVTEVTSVRVTSISQRKGGGRNNGGGGLLGVSLLWPLRRPSRERGFRKRLRSQFR